MAKQKRNPFLPLILLIAALTLTVGVAYARYVATLSGDQGFQVKPSGTVIAQQRWQKNGDAYILTFTAGEAADACRVYLAVSEGVVEAEQLKVSLTVPEEEAALASAEPIREASSMYTHFGPGNTFRFYDGETGEELVFSLSGKTCILTVEGLESAAQLTSLLRLFVEQVQE